VIQGHKKVNGNGLCKIGPSTQLRVLKNNEIASGISVSKDGGDVPDPDLWCERVSMSFGGHSMMVNEIVQYIYMNYKVSSHHLP